jgi:hypothetical protein
MIEQDQSTSNREDSHEPNKAGSTSNSEAGKQDGPIREGEGRIANERDVGLEETDQQALEKSRTAGSDTSRRDPKLVHLYCLPFSAEETN